jgi:hypothetical protein
MAPILIVRAFLSADVHAESPSGNAAQPPSRLRRVTGMLLPFAFEEIIGPLLKLAR